MTKAVRASEKPYATEVVEGETYYWCACGLSKTQPFCDGSHKDTDISPVKYVADESGTAYFCGCKATKNRPMCDGSHNIKVEEPKV